MKFWHPAGLGWFFWNFHKSDVDLEILVFWKKIWNFHFFFNFPRFLKKNIFFHLIILVSGCIISSSNHTENVNSRSYYPCRRLFRRRFRLFDLKVALIDHFGSKSRVAKNFFTTRSGLPDVDRAHPVLTMVEINYIIYFFLSQYDIVVIVPTSV